MIMKKIISGAIIAVMLTSSFTGCSDEKTIISYESAASETTPEKSPVIEADKISAVLLLTDDPKSGACLSLAHSNAFTAAANELNIKAKVKANVNADDMTSVIGDANVIFGGSYAFMNPMDEQSRKNPDTLYSCFGGYKHNNSNYSNYSAAVYEAQYLAGIAAGAVSESGKIGIISEYTTEYPDSAAEINSFALGAMTVNPDAKIIVRSLSSRTDTSKAEKHTNALIKDGCDVISIQCDSELPAKVAIKKDIDFIGYGVNMDDLGDTGCLASIIVDLKAYYTEALASVSDGTWAKEPFTGNLSNGAVALAGLAEDIESMTVSRIASAADLIKNGSFEIFSNKAIRFNTEGTAYTINAALIDNKSNVMISEDGSQAYLYSGDELKAVDPSTVTTDSLATASMNYLVAGVTVKE